MKILVIDLEGLSAELLFSDERLTNFRHLMEFGCYGMLEGFSPAQEFPAWVYMAAGQTPDDFAVESASFIWQHLATEGKTAIAAGPPYSDSTDIIAIPDSIRDNAALSTFTSRLALADVGDEEQLREAIFALGLQQFDLFKSLLGSTEWDYFHFMVTSLEQMQDAFWHHLDFNHPLHRPDNPHQHVVLDYYAFLDGQLADIFELLDDDTAVMIVSAREPTLTSNEAQSGFFILAAAHLPLSGEITGAHLLDISPTLLELSGNEIPDRMSGKSLLSATTTEEELSADEEELLRERLSGLGYI